MSWWQKDTNDEVATSPELWRPISQRVDGFDLDPAAGAESTPIATHRFTRDDDGLSKRWFGTVWLNPPFSDKTPWYRRLVGQYQSGNVDCAVALAPVTPSSQWFHRWFARADALCFLEGRDWYEERGSNPSFATMLGVWNPPAELLDWMSSSGVVSYPEPRDSQQRLCEVTP